MIVISHKSLRVSTKFLSCCCSVVPSLLSAKHTIYYTYHGTQHCVFLALSLAMLNENFHSYCTIHDVLKHSTTGWWKRKIIIERHKQLHWADIAWKRHVTDCIDILCHVMCSPSDLHFLFLTFSMSICLSVCLYSIYSSSIISLVFTNHYFNLQVSVSLTPAGLEHWEEVEAILYAHIQTLQKVSGQ
jgi:hypothetical protein